MNVIQLNLLNRTHIASLFTAVLCLLTAPAFAQTNVIVNDNFSDGSRTNAPMNETNSFWLSQDSGGATLTGVASTPSPNMLVASNAAASSRFFMAYFTTNSADPVQTGNTNAVTLNAGQMIRLTLDFTPSNVVSQTNNSLYGLRFGLFDLADGGGRTNRDSNVYNTSSATVAGTNILGYFVELNFLTAFNTDIPMQFWARTNVASLGNNLLSTALTNGVKLGAGPAGYTNLPGFLSGTNYTLELSVACYAASNVLKAKIYGGSLNMEQEFADTNSVVRRFDAFGVRSNRKEDCCDFLTLTRFKVETMPAPSGALPQSHPPFSISSIQTIPGDNVVLSWPSSNNWTYHVLSRADLVSGDWTTNATVAGNGGLLSYTNGGVSGATKKFIRILAPPQ